MTRNTSSWRGVVIRNALSASMVLELLATPNPWMVHFENVRQFDRE
jgi:hypothetical protein